MILGRAITAPSNRRKAYERARNWSEMQASGLDLEQYRDPKCEKEKGGAAAMYVSRLIEAQVTLQLANSGTADTADPYPVTKKMYSLLASNANIGEKELVAGGDAVLHTRKNSDGKIISASGRELTDPYVQLLTLLAESSIRNYVFILLNPDAEGSRKRGTFTANWEESVASYHQLVAKYGETAVLAAAAKIKAAPKTPQGYIVGDYQSTSLLDTFYTMLKDPKAIVPDGQIHRYEVSAFDPQWLGKRVILHGTVSRVRVDTTLRQPYIIINFKESPDGAVLAYSIDTDVFISRFGADFSGLVGKEVDLQGDLGVFREAKGALRLLYESRSQFQINVKVLSNP